ncbi:response regulator [Flavobacterium sp. WC2430]|uniref:response regulator n=1 Tax=Flavobacterium sp. WC2430 TaxID=3234137 RepID=UPI00346625FA
MKNLNIIVVDNKIDAQSTKDIFLGLNDQSIIYLAANEIEAWSLLQGNTKLSPVPKVIFIDINREGVNGMELLKKIRKHPILKSLLVFVLTNSDSNKNEALDLNIAGFIHKPMDKDKITEVYSILNAYLDIIEFPRDNNKI